MLNKSKKICILHFALCIAFSSFLTQPSFAFFGKKSPEEYFQKALDYYYSSSANTKKAKKYFLSTSKLVDNHYASLYNVSLINALDGNFKDTLKYVEEVKKLNPYDIRINKLYSATMMALGKNAESQATLNQILSKHPADIFTHKKLGLIALKENNIQNAIGKFSMVKNLAPNDVHNCLLLGAAHYLNKDYSKSYGIIKNVQNKISDDESRAFLALVLEKNNLKEKSEAIFDSLYVSDKEAIINNMTSSIRSSTIAEELGQLNIIKEYKIPDAVKQITANLAQEERMQTQDSIDAASSEAMKRPLDWKGTLTETFEFYDRTTKAASPINSLNVTSNLKLEGTTKDGVALSVEAEGFFNRWDNNNLDFYKINANKKDDYEVDLGKFSSKHFGTLVSYPTVTDGIRIWKKIQLPEFVPTDAQEIDASENEPVNLGEIYRENRIDSRSNKSVEFTAVVGRTLEVKNVGDRKEKNEGTHETTGQFEQWTQSYRLHTQVNSVLELGTSLALTQDINDKAVVSASTYPIESSAIGLDGGIDLLDNDLNIDAEFAHSTYRENLLDVDDKSLRDWAWLVKSKYKIFETLTFGYEQKAIGRHFKVEGASQTQDKTSHTIDLTYKPTSPKTWNVQSQTFQFKPEIVSPDGGGTEKKRYRTFQSVTEFKLPQDAKYTIDWKFYKEWDKCNCTNYRTTTMKNCFDWTIPRWNTTIKPSYVFERKNDMVASPTDEKKAEYIFSIENKSIKNLELDYSFERERKKYWGATTKSYVQYIHSVEAKYTIIPSRMDTTFKASQDFKDPSDTNKTDITSLTFDFNYTSKSGDDKFELKYERKNNIYMPWSDSSAYRQNYVKMKYTKKF